jgi:hypothetical protein
MEKITLTRLMLTEIIKKFYQYSCIEKFLSAFADDIEMIKQPMKKRTFTTISFKKFNQKNFR